MPVSLHEVADALHTVFTSDADDAARASGLVVRQRKLTGQAFVQTLTFGWLHNARATLDDLVEFAADNRLATLTKQGLDHWFRPAALSTLQELLRQALYRCIGTPARRLPLLNRFRGVYAIDGTSCDLDPSLAPWLPGCGGKGPLAGAAAIKLVATLEVTSGRLEWVSSHPGRMHDQAAGATLAPFERGAMLLFDLGFFNLDMLRQQDEQGVKWLCRVQSQTAVRFRQGGEKQSVAGFLAGQEGNRIDRPAWVGSGHQLRCRLLAERVPPEVAARRRESLLEDSRRKGQSVSAERLSMCEWSVYITNALRVQLTLEEALALYRTRWQVELLFKVWKGTGELDQSRGVRPERVLCEFYAKLLGLVVQHWATLVAGDPLEISEQRGARRIRKRAADLLGALLADSPPEALSEVLSELAETLRRWCRIEQRKADPNAKQRLQEAEDISRLQAGLGLT
jgi:hypothetical protein